MSAFEKVIGYEQVKQELRQIADTLKNREIYAALGVSSPRGLLLHGVPGVGKSLMAQCLIEESDREVFTCRKTEPNGEFVNTIKEVFNKAAESAPSIVYLDDMDKFANDDERHLNSEEFVTVQSCIDELRGKEVFVLATANETYCLPDSLTRAGRFDRVIEVEAPEGNDAERIIEHYLRSKKLSSNLDAHAITDILSGKSCATLETVINEAGLIAGYKRLECITMDQVVDACLRIVFHAEDADFDDEIDIAGEGSDTQIVWHEAGHAVVSEVLCPGSVVLASARRRSARQGGFVKTHFSNVIDPLRLRQIDIIVTLGGRAASESRFGMLDAGTENDLRHAYNMTRDMHEDLCSGGFSLYADHRASEKQQERVEIATAASVEDFYRKSKEILCKNRDFLEKMAKALASKDVLLASDVKMIREECEVVEIAI